MSGKYSGKTNDISRRLLGDMTSVLHDEGAIKGKENDVLYTVYRNIEVAEGRARYDITEIPARAGMEFPKTFGHYHKKPVPEIYEVLEGHAYFLIQKPGKDLSEIEEAYIIEALPGEKAVIPGEFGHLAINMGKDTLVMANWMGLSDYDYETYRQFRGGCYYILDEGETVSFEINKNYKTVPELKKIQFKNTPAMMELGVKTGKNFPIEALKDSPEKLDLLANPEKYKELLTIEKLYRKI